MTLPQLGPRNSELTYVSHTFEEYQFNLGEIEINYATTGNVDNPDSYIIRSIRLYLLAFDSICNNEGGGFQNIVSKTLERLKIAQNGEVINMMVSYPRRY